MQEIIQAIKDVFNAAIALGWQPWPAVIAVLMMVGLRSWFEPDVLQVNTPEARARHGKIKFYIFIGVFFSSLLMQVGLAKPAVAFDWCISIASCIADAMFGHVVTSSSKFKNLVRDKLGIGPQ